LGLPDGSAREGQRRENLEFPSRERQGRLSPLERTAHQLDPNPVHGVSLDHLGALAARLWYQT
jgi:hypothetical protein